MSREWDAWVAQILGPPQPEESPLEAMMLADYFMERGAPRLAASALDRAFGLRPDDPHLAARRCELLESLAVMEHGLAFRYVPAGTFLMGSERGEEDECPVRPVFLGDYWLSETCATWAAYCDLMGWEAPPEGFPADGPDYPHSARFCLLGETKIRLQYCETQTRQAVDWHAHQPATTWQDGSGQSMTSQQLFGNVPREDPSRPWQYNDKPMVAVAWQDAAELCERLSTPQIQYALPTEVQWEKAARGGRVGEIYSWGSQPPTRELCDFDHFGDFFIRSPKTLSPNDYGLYGMCGGVWEWTADEYDALAYRAGADRPPPADRPHTMRGGSWADCAEAVTVSFRMPRDSRSWRDEDENVWRRRRHLSPNVGFRICRVERKE